MFTQRALDATDDQRKQRILWELLQHLFSRSQRLLPVFFPNVTQNQAKSGVIAYIAAFPSGKLHVFSTFLLRNLVAHHLKQHAREEAPCTEKVHVHAHREVGVFKVWIKLGSFLHPIEGSVGWTLGRQVFLVNRRDKNTLGALSHSQPEVPFCVVGL